MDNSRSSLPLQMLLSVSSWLLPAFIIVEVMLFIFKFNILPYNTASIASEILLLCLYAAIEYGRIHSADRGNLTEKGLFVLISIVLSGPACTVLLYLLLWQTYVLKIEVALLGFVTVMQLLQVLMAFIVLLGFVKS